MKIIWWFLAAIRQDEELARRFEGSDSSFETHLLSFEETISKLTYQLDRDVVADAVKIFESNFGDVVK